jgi:hypothetical protein
LSIFYIKCYYYYVRQPWHPEHSIWWPLLRIVYCCFIISQNGLKFYVSTWHWVVQHIFHFFSVNFISANLYWLCISSREKNCIKIFGIAVKISLNGKKQNWKNRLKFRNQIENQENDYRTGSREPLVFW